MRPTRSTIPGLSVWPLIQLLVLVLTVVNILSDSGFVVKRKTLTKHVNFMSNSRKKVSICN